MAETDSTLPVRPGPGPDGQAVGGVGSNTTSIVRFGLKPANGIQEESRATWFSREGLREAQEILDSLDKYLQKLGKSGSFSSFIQEHGTFPRTMKAIGQGQDRNKVLAAAMACLNAEAAAERLREGDEQMGWLKLLEATRWFGQFRGADEYTPQKAARLMATRKNRETDDMKRVALEYYLEHEARFSSPSRAAEAIAGTIVPLSYRAVYDHLRKNKSLLKSK